MMLPCCPHCGWPLAPGERDGFDPELRALRYGDRLIKFTAREAQVFGLMLKLAGDGVSSNTRRIDMRDGNFRQIVMHIRAKIAGTPWAVVNHWRGRYAIVRADAP